MIDIKENISLKLFNTFGIDVKCRYFTAVKTYESLIELGKQFKLSTESTFILGGGSNILLTKDLDQLVLKINIQGIEKIDEDDEQVKFKVGSGVSWNDFVQFCVGAKLGGLENLSLIPGLVGAAPMQNIGAYGVEQNGCFVELEAIDRTTNSVRTFNKSECDFGYRSSYFKKEGKGKFIITSVTYSLKKKPVLNTSYGAIQETLYEAGIANPTIEDVSKAVVKIRKSKLPDPAEIGNAGSFFKNPVIDKIDYEGLKAEFPNIPSYEVSKQLVKIPAAWLIDQNGWKGYRDGDIGVHKNQALVLVNHGNGNGQKIRDLAFEIKEKVAQTYGIELEPEVNII
ncbi:MAG: UDP-N-acetylmuramate dehydrogenase [Bacteroidota bacterium]